MEELDFENTTELFLFNGTNATEAPSGLGYYYPQWSRCRLVPLPPPPTDRPFDTAKDVLWKLVPPFIVLIGVLGNLTTILVLTRSTKKMKSTILYLLILAISDTVFLINTPVRQWLRFTLDYDFRTWGVFVCKTSAYLTYSTYHFSSWLLVAVTLERVLSVLMPYTVQERCNKRASVIVILSLFLTFFGLNSHILFGVGHFQVGNIVYCQPLTREYIKFFTKTWPWIHFVVAFLLPFLILLVGNGIIIRQLRASQRERKRLSMADNETLKSKNQEKRAVMIMLILLSAVFFISQTPTIYFLAVPYYVNLTRQLPCDRYEDYTYHNDIIWFWYSVTSLLSYTNATCNFIMYVLSGSRFRGEVKALLCCQPPKTTEGAFDSRPSDSKSVVTKRVTTVSEYVTEQSEAV